MDVESGKPPDDGVRGGGGAFLDPHADVVVEGVEHGKLVEGLDDLKGSSHVQFGNLMGFKAHDRFSVEHDTAGCGAVITCKEIENGGLSSAIGADQGQCFPFV